MRRESWSGELKEKEEEEKEKKTKEGLIKIQPKEATRKGVGS